MKTLTGNQILVTFSSHSASRRTVVGPATKTNYGYRKHGDKFKVYEADMRVRPDLFVPIEQKPKAIPKPVSPVVKKADKKKALPPSLPPPPTLIVGESEDIEDELEPALADLEWDKINDRHLLILFDKDIITIGDVHRMTEEELLAIKGIGPVIAKELKDMGKEYPLIL